MRQRSEQLRLWLLKKLEDRGHGIKSELAKHLGIPSGQVTRMINPPGKEQRFIKAHELLAIEEFFKEKAPADVSSGAAPEAHRIFDELPDDLQEKALDYLLLLKASSGKSGPSSDQQG